MPDRSASDFGVRLKAAREARGVSLQQIASVTKISVPALEALERNDISRLPGGIFTRAFVRGYALEVGLDPEQTVEDFLASFPAKSVAVGHPQIHERDEQEVREHARRRHGRLTRAAWLIAAAVVIGIYLAIASLRGANPADADATAMEATAAAAEHPADAPADITPVAATAAADGLEIELQAHSPCWVSATIDGRRRSIERLLEPGDHASFQVDEEVILTAGDAAAITMTINGEPVRVLGRAGQVVTVRIDPDNYRSFLKR